METLKEFIKKHFENCEEVNLHIITPTMGYFPTIEKLKKDRSMLKQYVAEWSYQHSTFHIFLKETE